MTESADIRSAVLALGCPLPRQPHPLGRLSLRQAGESSGIFYEPLGEQERPWELHIDVAERSAVEDVFRLRCEGCSRDVFDLASTLKNYLESLMTEYPEGVVEAYTLEYLSVQ